MTTVKKPAYKPHPELGIRLEPYRPDPGLEQAMRDYLSKFSYHVELSLGASWTTEFKDFNAWCEQRLGTKYKDWFLYSTGSKTYILFLRNDRWASFLALTWVDFIV